MRFIITPLLITILSALSALSALSTAEVQQKRISLGISVDKEEMPFDGAKGVAIYSVHADSNAERLGLKKDDRIIKVNDTEITDFKTLAACIASFADGAQVTVLILRNDKGQSCSGILRAQIAGKDLKEREENLQKRLSTAQDRAIKKERYNLKDLLIILRQIEHDLPEAAKEFKKTYPNGRFKFSLDIDIDSDTTVDETDGKTTPPTNAEESTNTTKSE